MESIRSFLDAAGEFGERLAGVEPLPLALGLAFALTNLLLRARGWQNILRASYPQASLPYRDVSRAYVAGGGVNAVVPVRAGDIVKLFLVKRRAPQTRWPGLAASLVAETLFDWVIAAAILIWAIQAGVLPGLPRLPNIPAFDLSWAFRNPELAALVAFGVALIVWLISRRVRAFWAEFGAGLAILRTPGAYLRRVVSWQILAFACRVAGAYFFLEAFGVPGSLQNAVIVQVAGALASLFPATPGGLGPNQALLVVMLAGSATRGQVLAFSVGMELTLVAFNATIGLIALVTLTGGFGIRSTIRQARASRAEAESGPDPGG